MQNEERRQLKVLIACVGTLFAIGGIVLMFFQRLGLIFSVIGLLMAIAATLY